MKTKTGVGLLLSAVALTLCLVVPALAGAGQVGGVYQAALFHLEKNGQVFARDYAVLNAADFAQMNGMTLNLNGWPAGTPAEVYRVGLVRDNETIDRHFMMAENSLCYYITATNALSGFGVNATGVQGLDFTTPPLLSSWYSGSYSKLIPNGTYRFVVAAQSKRTMVSGEYTDPLVDYIYTAPFTITNTGRLEAEVGMVNSTARVFNAANATTPLKTIAPDAQNLMLAFDDSDGPDARWTQGGAGPSKIALMPAHYPLTAAAAANAYTLQKSYTASTSGYLHVYDLNLNNPDGSPLDLWGPYRFALWEGSDKIHYTQVFSFDEDEAERVAQVIRGFGSDLIVVVDGDIVKVSGSATAPAGGTYSLDIPNGVRVEWAATLTGTSNGPLISMEGLGTFALTGGLLANSGSGPVLAISEAPFALLSVDMEISGGILSGSVVTAPGKPLVVKGGNVDLKGKRPAAGVVDGSGNALLPTTITMPAAAGGAAVSALGITPPGVGESYGLTGTKVASDGKLQLWLPAGAALSSVTAGGVAYSVTVSAGGSATAVVPGTGGGDVITPPPGDGGGGGGGGVVTPPTGGDSAKPADTKPADDNTQPPVSLPTLTKLASGKVTIGKKSLKLSWKKAAAAQKVTGYQIQYKLKSAKKWSSKTVAANKGSLTIKGLKSGKVYQLRLRSVRKAATGATYSPWSKTITSKKVK